MCKDSPEADKSLLIRLRNFFRRHLFHELRSHSVAHSTEGDFADSETTPRNLREVEAEAVALLCCESLGLEGAEYCRGYMQNWLQPWERF